MAENVKEFPDVDLCNFVEVDRLKLFFGDDIIINDKIILTQPTIGQIVEFGERRFYSILSALTYIPSDLKSELWDMNHIDWQTVDDFELFMMLTRNLTSDDTKLFLGDIDLSKMIIGVDVHSNQPCLYDAEKEIKIDKAIYLKIITYIREMFNIHPKVERAKNKRTFNVLIEDDRFRKSLNKDKKYTSSLLPLISSMLNHPGFKYKKNELRDIGIVEFMDSVQRISAIVSTTALLQGSYSGMVDTSKIPKEQFNWLRDLSDEGKTHNGVMTIKQ